MQVAAARRGFRSLTHYWDAPARRKGAMHQTSASGQNGRTTRDFFHASDHTVRHNRRTETHRGGACAPFGAGAPRRPCRARGGGVPLASPSVSSKIHRTAKPTELYKRGLCGLGSACNEVRMTSHTRHGFTWVFAPAPLSGGVVRALARGALARKRDLVPYAPCALGGHVPAVSGLGLDLVALLMDMEAAERDDLLRCPAFPGFSGFLASHACPDPTECLRS